ncbi:MAG: NTP transferase domain-containing protein [Mangrovicoccus sp.]
MKILAALLAAGASRRFGAEDKLTAPLKARPLAAYSADLLTRLEGADKLVITNEPGYAALFSGLPLAPPLGADQSGSLRAAVAEARARNADKLLILLADMPFVPLSLVEKLLASPIRACAFDGQRRSPPAIFPRADFPQLAQSSGDQGARALLRQLPEAGLLRTTPQSLIDIDTPADLSAAEALKP